MQSAVILAFLISLLSSAPAAASGGALSRSLESLAKRNGTIQSLALANLVHNRCVRYFGNLIPRGIDDLKTQLECRQVALEMRAVLDAQVLTLVDETTGENGPTTVVFPKELRTLLRDRAAMAFVANLNSSLQLFPHVGTDLFELARRHAGNERAAVRWIAVLFQDISPGEAHVAYLKYLFATKPNEFTARDEARLALLEETVRRLRDHALNFGALHLALRFYPAPLDHVLSRLNPLIYHYYVPRYVAQRLAAAGVAQEKAAFAAFAFNYIYEVFRAFEKVDIGTLLREPKVMPEKTHADILLGYYGAFHGLGSVPSRTAESVSDSLKTSPRTMLQNLAVDLTARGIGPRLLK